MYHNLSQSSESKASGSLSSILVSHHRPNTHIDANSQKKLLRAFVSGTNIHMKCALSYKSGGIKRRVEHTARGTSQLRPQDGSNSRIWSTSSERSYWTICRLRWNERDDTLDLTDICFYLRAIKPCCEKKST